MEKPWKAFDKSDDSYISMISLWNIVVFHSKLLGLPEGTPYLAPPHEELWGPPR